MAKKGRCFWGTLRAVALGERYELQRWGNATSRSAGGTLSAKKWSSKLMARQDVVVVTKLLKMY